jgi:hypothetical protein
MSGVGSDEARFFSAPRGEEAAPRSRWGRQVALLLLIGLALTGALLALMSLFETGQGRGPFAAFFSGDDEVTFPSAGSIASSESATVASAEVDGAEERGVAENELVDSRRDALVDALASGPAGYVASFDDGPRQVRQVRQVRGGAGEQEERALVSEPRDRAKVSARVRAIGPSIQQCYERRMLTKGRLSGTVRVRFTVSSSGMVSNVDLSSSTLRDRDLLRCVRSRLASLRLGRGPVERYDLPLRLVPQG